MRDRGDAPDTEGKRDDCVELNDDCDVSGRLLKSDLLCDDLGRRR